MRMSRAVRFIALAVLFLIAVAAVTVAIQEGSWYRVIDRAQMAMRHLNRQVYHVFGWPLPGTPDLAALDARLKAKNLQRGDAVFMRVFKNQLELELWMQQ